MPHPAPYLSIIVPVLNEADSIRWFLTDLRIEIPEGEIIVVDGGSTDGTASLAGDLADRVIATPRGRALQMNAGAEAASGEILWFVHADSELPAGAWRAMQKVLRQEWVAGGCFRIRFPRPEWIYRVGDSLGNLGVKVFDFALGDHGIFCRRSAFFAAGKYPDVPILEDAELYRRLRNEGMMRQLRPEIVTSPRTFEACGRYRTTALYFTILALYVAGVSIPRLNRLYEWLGAHQVRPQRLKPRRRNAPRRSAHGYPAY